MYFREFPEEDELLKWLLNPRVYEMSNEPDLRTRFGWPFKTLCKEFTYGLAPI